MPECEGLGGPVGLQSAQGGAETLEGLIDATKYLPDWLVHAVPHVEPSRPLDSPHNCLRYAPLAELPQRRNGTAPLQDCPASMFSPTEKVRCDDWVFEPGQMNSIASEVSQSYSTAAEIFKTSILWQNCLGEKIVKLN